jgi:superfamily I DNA and RNA helicase
MTDQHRATPEEWSNQELWAREDSDSSCIVDLRNRIEALEARVSELQSCHNTTADHILDIMAMVRGTAQPSPEESLTAPADSLVERVRSEVASADSASARAAIHAVAAWLRARYPQSPEAGAIAFNLDQEA